MANEIMDRGITHLIVSYTPYGNLSREEISFTTKRVLNKGLTWWKFYWNRSGVKGEVSWINNNFMNKEEDFRLDMF